MFSLLNRREAFLDSSESSNELTSTQAQTDEMLQNFSHEASNVNSLIGMTAASLAFKFVKLGFLAKTSTSLAQFVPKLALNGAASALGLMAEVTTFRGSNKFLSELSGDKNQQDIFDRKGWLGTAVDFLALKSIGHLGAKQNFVLREFATANAMVLGHEMSAQFGFTNREAGSYVEKLAHAEAMNIAMAGGTSLLGTLTGGRFHQAERVLELSAEVFFHYSNFQKARQMLDIGKAEIPAIFFHDRMKKVDLSLPAISLPNEARANSHRPITEVDRVMLHDVYFVHYPRLKEGLMNSGMSEVEQRDLLFLIADRNGAKNGYKILLAALRAMPLHSSREILKQEAIDIECSLDPEEGVGERVEEAYKKLESVIPLLPAHWTGTERYDLLATLTRGSKDRVMWVFGRTLPMTLRQLESSLPFKDAKAGIIEIHLDLGIMEDPNKGNGIN